MQEQQKNVVETPNPLKIPIQGRYSKWGKGTGDDRDVHYPWGTASARCRRRIHVAGLLVAVFCAHISMLAPQRSLPEHNPKLSARKKLPDCLLPRVHKNKSMQRLISSPWGPGTAKFQQSGRSVNLRTPSCHGKKARCGDAIVRVVSRSISAESLPKWTSKLSSRVEGHDIL